MRFHPDDDEVEFDWVVLAALLIGFGLVGSAMLQDWRQTRQADVVTTIPGLYILDSDGPPPVSLVVHDASSTSPIDGTARLIRAATPGREVVELPVEIEAGHDYALVEFDVVLTEDWHGLAIGTFSIDGMRLFPADPRDGPSAPRESRTIEGSDGKTLHLTHLTDADGQGTLWRTGIGRSFHVSMVRPNDGSVVRFEADRPPGTEGVRVRLDVENVTVGPLSIR